MESQFKILIGRETTALGEPVVIVTAQSEGDDAFISEHFVILPGRGPSLERSRIRYKLGATRQRNDLVTLNDVMTAEVQRTRAWLHDLVQETLTNEEKAAKHLYVPYILSGIERASLVQFKLTGKFQEELKKVRQSTRCTELHDYLSSIEKIPPIQITEEPMLTNVA